MTDSWDDIVPPSSADIFQTRRADPDHPLVWFRGKDWKRNYLFIFECSGSDLPLSDLPKLENIEISFLKKQSKTLQLVLTLLDPTHIDIFRALCANLMEATATLNPKDNELAFVTIINRLERWRRLLKNRRNSLLSKPAQIGLFGELIFLSDYLFKHIDKTPAIHAWKGPLGAEQDFSIGSWLIEVKTQLTSSDRIVQISSAEQLDTISGSITLCHQTLGTGTDLSGASMTLNGLVDEIITDLKTASAYDLFLSILLEVGYEKHEEYDKESWQLAERSFYDVSDGFPRLTPALCPPGVSNVHYAISIDSCREFMIPNEMVEGRFRKI